MCIKYINYKNIFGEQLISLYVHFRLSLIANPLTSHWPLPSWRGVANVPLPSRNPCCITSLPTKFHLEMVILSKITIQNPLKGTCMCFSWPSKVQIVVNGNTQFSVRHFKRCTSDCTMNQNFERAVKLGSFQIFARMKALIACAEWFCKLQVHIN